MLRPKYIMDFHSHYYHYYYSITKEAIIVLTILLGQKGKLGRIWTFQVWERIFFLSNSIVEREDI